MPKGTQSECHARPSAGPIVQPGARFSCTAVQFIDEQGCVLVADFCLCQKRFTASQFEMSSNPADPSPLPPGTLSARTKPLVQVARQAERDALVQDTRLRAVFMAASAPAVTAGDDPRSPAAVAGGASSAGQALSGPQAADIVRACGLLRWLPADNAADSPEGEHGGRGGGGGAGRLVDLVELVARAASSRGGIDDGHVTNVLWALERLGISTAQTAKEDSMGTVEGGRGAAGAAAAAEEEVVAAAREKGRGVAADVVRSGGRGLWEGNRAVEELRKRVEDLPFRAIPSLFEGLRVEDFREEVAFGRDEILLGGGKVRHSSSRLMLSTVVPVRRTRSVCTRALALLRS